MKQISVRIIVVVAVLEFLAKIDFHCHRLSPEQCVLWDRERLSSPITTTSGQTDQVLRIHVASAPLLLPRFFPAIGRMAYNLDVSIGLLTHAP